MKMSFTSLESLLKQYPDDFWLQKLNSHLTDERLEKLGCKRGEVRTRRVSYLEMISDVIYSRGMNYLDPSYGQSDLCWFTIYKSGISYLLEDLYVRDNILLEGLQAGWIWAGLYPDAQIFDQYREDAINILKENNFHLCY